METWLEHWGEDTPNNAAIANAMVAGGVTPHTGQFSAGHGYSMDTEVIPGVGHLVTVYGKYAGNMGDEAGAYVVTGYGVIKGLVVDARAFGLAESEYRVATANGQAANKEASRLAAIEALVAERKEAVNSINAAIDALIGEGLDLSDFDKLSYSAKKCAILANPHNKRGAAVLERRALDLARAHKGEALVDEVADIFGLLA